MVIKLVFFIFISFYCNYALLAESKIDNYIKVGIYDNEPKVFFNLKGVPAGIFVDILEEIKKSESWEIDYVSCQWSDCLKQLKNGELDIMPDVAYTLEREKKFLFSDEAFLSSWSVL